MKSILEIKVPGRENRPDVLEEVKNRFYQELLPVMESVFDDIGQDDRLIRLEHLEIDLGELENIRSEVLVNRFENLLRNQLREKIPRGKNAAQVPEESDRPAQEIFWFLEYGSFPWWSHTANARELEKEFLVLIQKERSFVKHLEVLLSEDKSLRRFVFSFSDDFINKTVPALLSSEWNNARDHFELMAKMLEKTDRDFQSSMMFRLYLEQLLLLKHKLRRWDIELLTENFITAYFKSLYKEEDISGSLNKISKWIKGNTEGGETGKLLKMVSEVIHRISGKNELSPQPEEQLDEWMDTDPAGTAGINAFEDRLKDELSKRQRKFYGDEHYIENAGLILLYPYLKRLFMKTALLKDDILSGLPELDKALLMLHYAVWKDTAAAENKMLLNKILCGLPEDYPVNMSLKLSFKEKKETDGMLRALIENWQVLKSTSPDGLREGFLQREGLLEFRDDHWKLRVTRKGVDLLLEKLPYSLGIVALPWMKHHISVEW